MAIPICRSLRYLSVVLLCLGGTALLAGEVDVPAPASGTERITLAWNPKEPMVGSTTMFVQSKTLISMLLVPETTLMSQLAVAGTIGLQAEEGGTVMTVLTQNASLSYYAAAEPNREIDAQTVANSLLVSGIPSPGMTVKWHMTPTGDVSRLENVPASCAVFFSVNLLQYPDHPVAVGEPWVIRKPVPFAPDLNTAPVWSDMVATLTLAEIDTAAGEGRIVLAMQFTPVATSSAAAEASQAKGLGGGALSGTTEGEARIRLSDGLPRRIETRADLKIEFGGGNRITLQQRFETDNVFR